MEVRLETVKTAKRAFLIMTEEKPFCRQATRGKGVRPPSGEYGIPDYAVAAHGRARLEVTEMKAPATFTPVLI